MATISSIASTRKDYIYREINIQVSAENLKPMRLPKELRKEFDKKHAHVWNQLRKCEFSNGQKETLVYMLIDDIVKFRKLETDEHLDVNIGLECVYDDTPKKKTVRLIVYMHRDQYRILSGLQGVEFTREWERVKNMEAPQLVVKGCVEKMGDYLHNEYDSIAVDYETSEREYREVCEEGPKAIQSDMD